MSIKLKDVRCSFLVLAEPEYFGGSKQKPEDKRRWSATALIPADSEQRKMVDDALRAVAKEQWPQKWETMLANILPDPKGCCWVDGARKDFDGYKGHWALTAHRTEDKGRPLVYDTDKSHIMKQVEIAKDKNGQLVFADTNETADGKAGRLFSGCFVNMQVEIWAQDNKAGKALRATLQGIQRNRIGEAFGGGRPPDPNDFEKIAGDEEESLS